MSSWLKRSVVTGGVYTVIATIFYGCLALAVGVFKERPSVVAAAVGYSFWYGGTLLMDSIPIVAAIIVARNAWSGCAHRQTGSLLLCCGGSAFAAFLAGVIYVVGVFKLLWLVP